MPSHHAVMSTTTHTTTQVRLSAPTLDFWVDVTLRSFGERWIAAAEIGGEVEIGLGASARQALTASLVSLGKRARACLLADTALLAPSVALLGAAGA
jgi:hypothetical protein